MPSAVDVVCQVLPSACALSVEVAVCLVIFNTAWLPRLQNGSSDLVGIHTIT